MCESVVLSPLCTTSPSPTIHTERDIIGLTESSRLVYFAAQADLEDRLTVSRAMLKRLTLTQTCAVVALFPLEPGSGASAVEPLYYGHPWDQEMCPV